MRPDPVVLRDTKWPELFLNYKVARLLLRMRLCRALAAEDYYSASALQEAWRGSWGFPKGATPEQQVRLATGRFLVPGVCIRHRQHGYRGVVLGCEPWARALMARRLPVGPLEGVPRTLQPLYHVLVDERDAARLGAAFVAECDLEPCTDAFPVKSRFVGRLLEPHDEIQGYLPGEVLKQAIRRQHHGMPLVLRPLTKRP